MIFLKFLHLLFFLFPFTYGSCPISKCGNSGSIIRFPFRLQGHQPENCSYPGFDLACDDQRNTVLTLEHSGSFFAGNIDYITPQIGLYDPDNCLPRRFLNFLNLSNSPFAALHYQNYTFLSCPTRVVNSQYAVINCLSNSTTSVLATTSMNLATSMPSSCKIMVTLPIPVSRPVMFEESFSSDLNSDLFLTWKVPDCRDCEGKGGTCGIYNDTVKQIVCFYNMEQGNKRSSQLSVFRILAMSITIPAMACSIAVALFICFSDRTTLTQQTQAQTAVSPQPIIVTTGLDDRTIESYTKMVLGESKRLPGPNDSTCPICLADYCTKETLRCIPECKHCFHAECIDEWLRMNITCPICRNSPSPVRVN